VARVQVRRDALPGTTRQNDHERTLADKQGGTGRRRHSRCWSCTIISARQLADAYDFTDVDGSKPDCWGHLAAYGWDHSGGEGIEDFR